MRYPIQVKENSVLIADELFHLDSAEQVLVRSENSDCKILLAELVEDSGHYKVSLDARTMMPVRGSDGPDDIVEAIHIRLPLELGKEDFWKDAESISAFNRESRTSDNRVHLVDAELAMRLSGKLPVIEICGDEFTIDLRLAELRHVHSEPMTHVTKIHLNQLEPDFENDRYMFLYDTVKKCEYLLDHDAVSIPEQVKAIAVPSEFELDPVGYGIKSGMGPTAWLVKYPARPKLEAVVIPMKDTNIPEAIRANRERLADSLMVRTEKLKEVARQEKKQSRGKRKRPLL
ncbi:hypothetical protein [Pedobacter chitinilyticus]|uniref:Uncharacterized protein n=1 Tax=Pedobacter chitinilyticus TaxID=2233776 RepID=A0A443YVX8_9SPHI|nr:hypothetical protein [Pedobacter chitinilyticus]RWU08135.1 hypothetical protein DPV69_07075 [Pedobacter chitinilyticus]